MTPTCIVPSGETAAVADESFPAPAVLTCGLCGQTHLLVPLAARERALCVRCGRTLAKGSRLGADAALAFAFTGMMLAIPAATMPFVIVGKLGNERTGLLFTGVDAMWHADMRALALWILVCGGIAPLVLLAALGGLLWPAPPGQQTPRVARTLKRIVGSLENWAMPEVQVLAVLVAFTKLGSLVDVRIGPGLWCYAGMAVATLLAWRSFDLATPNVRGGSP
jgi:paraquat-inducible protein A